VQAEVALAPLDLAEERPVDAALVGEGLLTKAKGFAPGSDTFAKDAGSRGKWLRHVANPIRPDCLCPEQIHPMSISPNCWHPDTVPGPT
jgi:hypothetical protein